MVGVNNYVVGSLPWYIKALASLTGRHGDREEGLQQVKKVTETGNYAREDAKLMLAVLSQREKMYAQALALYQGMARSYPRNYLLQYEVANLFGAEGLAFSRPCVRRHGRQAPGWQTRIREGPDR